MSLRKIVSGGQTGVDRGALDAALAAGLPCGGWIPADGKAEDGVIPDRYGLLRLPEGDHRQRTRLNALDSDGTVIVYNEHLSGGARLTRNFCALLNRRFLLLDARTYDVAGAVAALSEFLEDAKVEVLNVAGPRASGWSHGYAFTRSVIAELITQQTARLDIRREFKGI
jgi:hypothetical protein